MGPGNIQSRQQIQDQTKRTKTEIISENISFGPRRMQKEGEELKMPPEKADSNTEDLPVLEEESGKVIPDDIPF